MLERKVHRQENLCSCADLRLGESHMKTTLPHCCLEGTRAAFTLEFVRAVDHALPAITTVLLWKPVEGRRGAGSPSLWARLLKTLPLVILVSLMLVQMQGPSRRLEGKCVEQAWPGQDNSAGLHWP